MTSRINMSLSTLIDNMQNDMLELDLPSRFSALTDESIITKIATTCDAIFTYSWKTETGRERYTKPCGFSQTIDDVPSFSPLQSETTIRESLRQEMINKANQAAKIELDQLDQNATCIYSAITAKEPTEMGLAAAALIAKLAPPSDDPIPLTKERLDSLLAEAIVSAFLKHPVLVQSSFQNEKHNPIAKIMTQPIIRLRASEIIQEQDRFSRVKQVFVQHLANISQQFSEFMQQSAGIMQNNPDYQQTIHLREVEYAISLSNGQEEHNYTVKCITQLDQGS